MTESPPPKRTYRSNFLTNVIFRVDFTKSISIDDPDSIERYHDRIISKFSEKKKIGGGVIEYEFNDFGVDVKKKEPKTSWQFLTNDQSKIVMIDSDFIYIECLKYSNFAEFFEEIKLVFETANEFFNLTNPKRIGLRYINQIKLPTGSPFDWDGLINENLFSAAKNFIVHKENLLRNLQFIEMREEKYRLKFQFGFFNSEYPNAIARREFVLDYDCFSSEEVEASEITLKAKLFNEAINSWFEQSISDGLRKIMGVIDSGH